ncbi:MAG: molybdopterin molybdotransferase MoeA, partial [Gammaproteobacteria bacterium]|nr:molybdopterin molybdotransferase MoeA [Gammaproteobacteria bacterium]
MGKTHISPDALTVAEALRRIEAAVQPAPGYTQLPIKNALEKILAEAVCSGINVPPYANSAMDGYALRGADLSACLNFTVIGISWAGKPFDGETGAGQCVRIMTGAAMPRGTDTVIMQEHTVREGDNIRIEADRHKSGENVRQAGEDIAEGQIVLNPGKRLMPADIGLLASLGIPEVKVKRRVRAAFFSTGDELRSVGESLGPGQIYDSNRYTLYGMLTRLGIDFLDLGIIPDQREATEQALQTAASEAALVLTAGGVSVGDADYVTETLQQQGQV